MFISQFSHEYLMYHPIISRGGRYAQTFDILPLRQYIEAHHRLSVEDVDSVILVAYLDLLRDIPEGREIMIGDHTLTSLFYDIETNHPLAWLKELAEDLIHHHYSYISGQIDIILQLLYTWHPRTKTNLHGIIFLSDIGVEGNHLYLMS